MTINKFVTLLIFSYCIFKPEDGYAEHFTYINYSPDIRYSLNKSDSRINFDCGTSGYSYGNIFGNFTSWNEAGNKYFSFDFMAIAAFAEQPKIGDTFKSKNFIFDIVENKSLNVLGQNIDALKVNVKNKGEFANSFLY